MYRGVGKHFGTGGDRLTVLEPLDLQPCSRLAHGVGRALGLRQVDAAADHRRLEQPDPGGSVSIGDDEPQAVRKRGELAIAFQDAPRCRGAPPRPTSRWPSGWPGSRWITSGSQSC